MLNTENAAIKHSLDTSSQGFIVSYQLLWNFMYTFEQGKLWKKEYTIMESNKRQNNNGDWSHETCVLQGVENGYGGGVF